MLSGSTQGLVEPSMINPNPTKKATAIMSKKMLLRLIKSINYLSFLKLFITVIKGLSLKNKIKNICLLGV